jgi:prepilin-type N-terminal cleavage/methylation domain-containing protein
MTHLVTVASRRGFTLLEVMAALGLLAGSVLAVAQLVVVASRESHLSRVKTTATSLAGRQLEHLQSLAWGYAADGAAVGELALSPPGALEADTVGFVDYLDDGGVVVVGSGLSPPHSAVFTRRWSLEPDDGRVPPRTIVLRVVVLRREVSRARTSSGTTTWVETIRLVGVRTRRPD